MIDAGPSQCALHEALWLILSQSVFNVDAYVLRRRLHRRQR
jgi:hypothetical protein